jgi:hypothetical protein
MLAHETRRAEKAERERDTERALRIQLEGAIKKRLDLEEELASLQAFGQIDAHHLLTGLYLPGAS